MSKHDIIEDLGNQKVVETIINNISKGSFECTDDLGQDIYIELFNIDEEKLVSLYLNKQIKFWIVRMIKNNLFSKNSRYYYNYKRWIDNKSPELTDSDIENNSENYHNYSNLISD